jgi:hypothetical protein
MMVITMILFASVEPDEAQAVALLLCRRRHRLAPVFDWMVDLGKHHRIISDGCTPILKNLIITTVPLSPLKVPKADLA